MRRVCEFFHKEYTLRKWTSNPFQMYMVAMIFLGSLLQVYPGPSPRSVLSTEIPYSSALFIAICSLIGTSICLYGLHLRQFDRALVVEILGYISIVVVMALYLGLLLIQNHGLQGFSYPMGFAAGTICACFHRTIQIYRYFRARKRGDTVALWVMLGKIEPEGKLQ